MAKSRKSGNVVRAVARTDENDPCAFCRKTTDHDLKLGKFYTIGKISCHHFCVLLSSCLVQSGSDKDGLLGFMPEDMDTELRRGKRLRCHYCSQNGATLVCCSPVCRVRFHLPCGLENNCLPLFYDTFQVFCSKHRPKQQKPLKPAESTVSTAEQPSEPTKEKDIAALEVKAEDVMVYIPSHSAEEQKETVIEEDSFVCDTVSPSFRLRLTSLSDPNDDPMTPAAESSPFPISISSDIAEPDGGIQTANTDNSPACSFPSDSSIRPRRMTFCMENSNLTMPSRQSSIIRRCISTDTAVIDVSPSVKEVPGAAENKSVEESVPAAPSEMESPSVRVKRKAFQDANINMYRPIERYQYKRKNITNSLKQKDSNALQASTCPICMEEVDNQVTCDTIWPPCCGSSGDRWFHRECLERLAASAGKHFFKCPLCNDRAVFGQTMRQMGIYVPNQDASWELADTSWYGDLYERHGRCDSQYCLNPRGRYHSHKRNSWELLLCVTCGSYGTHRQCLKGFGGSSLSPGTQFCCNICKNAQDGGTAAERRSGYTLRVNLWQEPQIAYLQRSQSERQMKEREAFAETDFNTNIPGSSNANTKKNKRSRKALTIGGEKQRRLNNSILHNGVKCTTQRGPMPRIHQQAIANMPRLSIRLMRCDIWNEQLASCASNLVLQTPQSESSMVSTVDLVTPESLSTSTQSDGAVPSSPIWKSPTGSSYKLLMPLKMSTTPSLKKKRHVRRTIKLLQDDSKRQLFISDFFKKVSASL